MERTLAILKPDCIRKKLTGRIINKIEEAGFNIIAMKKLLLNKKEAEAFYAVHKDKSFFPALINFMTKGPSIVAVLEKENAVHDYRELIGATNPEEAKPGTIRFEYAESTRHNIVHGSDSAENAKKEIYYFFSEKELVSIKN